MKIQPFSGFVLAYVDQKKNEYTIRKKKTLCKHIPFDPVLYRNLWK